MKKLLGVLTVAGLLIGAANAQVGRLYFDLAGNDGTEGGARSGPTAQNNPELAAGGGRLYIYWQFGHADQNMLGLGVDINIDGDGAIGEAFYYNPTIDVFGGPTRWNQSAPNPAGGGGGQSVAFQAANVNQFGLINQAGVEGVDNQFDPTDGTFGSTLLGYVDVTGSGGNEIKFSGNNFGIAEEGGSSDDLVWFGFDDEAVRGSDGTSRLADATIVPEPASLMLLGLGFLALRRRR